MSVGKGSRAKSALASYSSRDRARLTKCVLNLLLVKNSTTFLSTSPSSRFWPRSKPPYPGKADHVEVMDYFGRDENPMADLPHLRRVAGGARAGQIARIAALTELCAAHLVEKYTGTPSNTPVHRGGLPIHQLRKVDDYVTEEKDST